MLAAWLERKALGLVADRIRKNPRSKWALWQMFTRQPLQPRLWLRGEVAQLIRVEATWKRRPHSLILLAQETPIPPRPPSPFEVLFGGKRASRRIYAISISARELETTDGTALNPAAEADAAAEAMAAVLGVPVDRARFAGRNLVAGQ
jgi:hypothetical protein